MTLRRAKVTKEQMSFSPGFVLYAVGSANSVSLDHSSVVGGDAFGEEIGASGNGNSVTLDCQQRR